MADDDLAADHPAARIVIQFKTQHVGWAGLVQELFVQDGHLPPGDDGDGKLPQGRAQRGVGLAKLAAEGTGV